MLRFGPNLSLTGAFLGGSANVLAGYAANGFTPEYVTDYVNEVYFSDSTKTTFDAIHTFTRTSTATYFDSTGTLQTAASGEPRIGHHVFEGGEWVNKGILIESEARTNLFIQSNDFTAATGAWNLGQVTIAENAIGPDGVSNSATTMTANGATNNATVNELVTVATSTKHTASVFVKAGTSNFFSYALAGFTTPSGVPRAYFNLSTGSLGTIDAKFDDAKIVNFGGGWYRCSVTFTTDSSDTSGQVYLVVSGGDSSISASEGDSILIYGAQVEAGAAPSSYIPTAGAQVTRAAETLKGKAATVPSSATALSIAMDGLIDYFDTGNAAGADGTFYRWLVDSSNELRAFLRVGQIFAANQRVSGSSFFVTSGSGAIAEGLNQLFEFGVIHSSSLLDAAFNGNNFAQDNSVTGLPDTSSTDLDIGPSFSGTISTVRVWADDIGNTGLDEVAGV